MKAAVVEKQGLLTVREVPQPEPGPYDVLCELLYGATCTGTDLHLIDAVFPWPPEYPAILGHESVGRVIAKGEKVRNFKEGDLVSRVGAPRLPQAGLDICWGGFAEYGIGRDHWVMRRDGLPSSEWSAYRVNQIIPGNIDPRFATMIITWRETLSYLKRMGIHVGQSLLVIGSGGNGLSFIRHATNLGAYPVVMLGSHARQDTALRAGASHFIDFRLPDWSERLKAICPAGFDFVIDALGRKTSVQDSLGQVSRGGTFGIYGVDDFGQAAIDPFKARGPFRWNPNEYDEAETHAEVIDGILSGKLDASIWLDLDHPYPLEQIEEAYQALRRKEIIKALIQIK
jgi:D-arabinose 1-dehydrogenase-like Zn-dependent alcohol dehydrogenase